MIAQVLDVDMAKRTANVIVQGAAGTSSPVDVKLTHRCSPAVDDFILIMSDGGEYYGIDKVDVETQEAVEAAEGTQLVPGDEILGDPESGPGIAVRKGGLLSILADQITGIVLSKVTGMLQFFGKRVHVDTTFFHGRIRTQEDETNSSVELSLFGSPFGNPLSTEIIQAAFDTLLARGEVNLAGIQDINVNLNIAPQTGILTGPSLNLQWATPQGFVKLKVNGATGVVEVESPTIMKLTGQLILINSEGNPLDRVLTAKDLCCYTGNMHGQGSGKVYVGP